MRRSRASIVFPRYLSILACAALAVAAPVAAQITVVPTFQVGPAPLVERAFNAEVGVATDGSVLFAWSGNAGGPHVSVRRMSAGGIPYGPSKLLGNVGFVRGLAANASGYLTTFDDGGVAVGGISGRQLDVLGDGVAAAFGVSDATEGGVSSLGVASLPSGAVFVWEQNGQFRARLFDGANQPRAASFVVDATGRNNLGRQISVAAMPGGGFVVAWGYFASFVVGRARVYDANGVPQTPILTVGSGSVIVGGVAASPLGGFVVAGARVGGALQDPTEVNAYRFADDGTALGTTLLGQVTGSALGLAKIAFNAAGEALVVWTEYHFVGPDAGPVRNRGRALAADGAAVSFPFLLDEGPVELVRTAALPDGTFVNSWVNDGNVFGNVVRPCTAGDAVCGDGVTGAECEQCDDAAGNSDTTPDACRTNCALPICGDGITDPAHGEECDDANGNSCDGCTPLCQAEIGLVCGDGAIVPGCGTDQCDDGNQNVGDGCDPTCTLEPILGGGNRATDCTTAWTVDNPTNAPLRDKNGEFRNDQVCVDNDPRCDFDGGVAGSCLFHVQVCADLTDINACTPPTRLRSWTLKAPSAAKATRKPTLAAVRAALATVPGSIVGPDRRNVCTDWLAVPLPLRQKAAGPSAAKLSLKAIAETYEGVRDADKLTLTCLP